MTNQHKAKDRGPKMRLVRCETCDGQAFIGKDKCEACDGKGGRWIVDKPEELKQGKLP